MQSTFKRLAAVSALFALCACAAPVRVAENTSFTWTSPVKRVLFVQPDVQLGELSAGGTVEPRADWTKTAEDFIATDARSWLQAKRVELAPMEGALSAHATQIIKLNGVVGQAILTHLNAGALKLPSKGNALDWTLGPGTNELRDRYGADYALFIFVRDSYTTTGRAIFMIGAAMLGVAIPGGQQTGFASLVDLRTGRIVWFNRILNSTGDLRTEKPAQDTVDALLKDFPL